MSLMLFWGSFIDTIMFFIVQYKRMRLRRCSKILRYGLAFFLVCNFVLQPFLPTFNNVNIVSTVYANVQNQVAVVSSTGVNVRSGPGTGYRILGLVTTGYRAQILGTHVASDKKIWYKISYNGHDGYIREDFLKFMKPYTYDANFEAALNSQGFPESYKDGLRILHANYPNWTFYAQHTGLDWSYAVDQEMQGGRSLVLDSSISSYKSTEDGKYDWNTSKWVPFDSGVWVGASRELVSYYMDPRNFLSDPYIFQFETQDFVEGVHTLAGLQELVKGTFLSGYIQTTGSSFTTERVSTNASPSTGSAAQVLTTHSRIYDPGVSMPSQNFGPNGGSLIIETPKTQTNLTLDSVIPVLPQNVAQVAGPGVMGFSSVINSIPNVSAPPIASSNSKSGVVRMPEKIKGIEKTFITQNVTTLPAGTYTYAEVIMDACRQTGMSPYSLTATILQEVGTKGDSKSISGNNAKYPGYYNYINVGAYSTSNMTAVERGLWFAGQTENYGRPWNRRDKAIYGAASYYVSNFILEGQDTLYLKKWNVNGYPLFEHQYMTNVKAAAAESIYVSNAYSDTFKSLPNVFFIPVFENMPASACPLPTKDGSPNNKLKSLSVNGYNLTPAFDKDTIVYMLVVPGNVTSVNVKASPLHLGAKIAGTGKVDLPKAINNAVITVTAENGDSLQYIISIARSGITDETTLLSQQYATGANTGFVVPVMPGGL